MDAAKYSKQLLSRGFCVVPLGHHAAAPAVKRMLGKRPCPEKTSPGLVEFLPTGDDEPGSHPGFGSCGLPTSMHCPETRHLLSTIRNEIFKPIVHEMVTDDRVVAALGEEKDKFWAMLLDRWCQRRAGIVPTKETPHRDISPDSLIAGRTCLVFGGFYNANEHGSQTFTCSPGTHIIGPSRGPFQGPGIKSKSKSRRQGSGFAAMSKEEARTYSFESIDVPPGSCLIFFENIVHKVRARRYKYDILRLFTAFQIWSGEPPCDPGRECRAPDLEGRPCFPCMQCGFCRDGTLTHVKSKQNNRVFPGLYPVNFRKKLKAIRKQVPALDRGDDMVPLAVHPPVELEKPYTEAELRELAGERVASFRSR